MSSGLIKIHVGFELKDACSTQIIGFFNI